MKICIRWVVVFLICSICFSLKADGKYTGVHDTVRVVGDIYYLPYQKLDSDGEPSGMAVDLVREAMRRLHREYTIQLMPKTKVMAAFNDRRSPTIALGLTNAGSRDSSLTFGVIYRYVFENMVCRKKESYLYNKVSDMRGKRIMVERGSYPEELLRKMGFTKELTPVGNIKKAFIALSQRQCDVIFCPGEMAFYVIDELDMTDKLERKDASMDPVKYGMAGNDSLLLGQIEKVVIDMKQDGTYDEIYNKWFYNADRSKEYLRILNYIGTILILLVAFVVILRRKVKNARKELAEKNSILVEKEKHLSQLLQRYTILFDNTTVGTQIYDAEGYLVACNKANCDMYGVENTEQAVNAGINIFDNPVLKPYIDQDNLKPVIFVAENDFEKMKAIRYFKPCNRGGLAYFETRITPVYSSENRLVNIIVNVVDVTENHHLMRTLQDYVDKMKFIFASSGVRTWEFYPDTKLCRVNSKDGQIHQIEWRDVIELVEEDDRQKMDVLLAKMNGREIDKFFLNLKLAGETSYRSLEVSAVKDDGGHVSHYIGLSHDITDFITIQKRLEEEKEKAQSADKLKSAFLANMSHEIRTPLNAIVGFSQMLPKVDDEDTRKNLIDIILTNNDILLHLIDNILNLSKAEAGIIKVHPTEVDLVESIRTMCDTFQFNARAGGPRLISDIPVNSYKIVTDNDLLVQVLFNLLSNAFKFTKHGHVRIGFHAEDGGVRIYVEDTGMGIPEDKFETIFHHFEQIDSFSQGMGLGLSICKANVMLMKGRIGLQSTPGAGSTFWFWIPVR